MTTRRGRTRTSNRLRLVAAVGSICGIAPGAASAIEIGEIDVQSTLGQPLRASISYALNANESLHDYCIALRSGTPSDGIPVLSRARLQITSNAILLTGRTPIREPMLSMQLTVNCPYTPRLARNFMLLINPTTEDSVAPQPAYAPSEQLQARPTTLAVPAVQTQQPASVMAARSVSSVQTPISAATRYQVQPGDTLSSIAARTEGRSAGLMEFVDAIFFANPDAFINGDKNLLQAGSWLNIPGATGVASVPDSLTSEESFYSESPDVTAEFPAEQASVDSSSMDAYPGFTDTAVNETETNTFDSGFASQPVVDDTVAEAPMFPDEDYGDLVAVDSEPDSIAAGSVPPDDISAEDSVRPGDVFVAEDSPFPAADVVPADVAAESVPEPASSVPVVASAPAESSGSWGWLIWAGGASLGFILGFALFSRRLRERFGKSPTPASKTAETALDDTNIDLTASQIVVPDVDFKFDDTPAEQPEISLDADLGDGSGLQGSAEIDVAQDFGFSAENDLSSEMDLELPEVAAQDDEKPSTDIIPPHLVEESSILKSEVTPSDADDGTEYDLSMIVDATKQRIGETEQTARDLMAVPVDPDSDDAPTSENLTINEETDFVALEQDYEEELTQTQALNAEIAKAAVEIAEQMDETEIASMDDIDDDAPTGNFAEIPAALDIELPDSPDFDVAAELTGTVGILDDAVNDELGDADATEIADPDATEIADLDDTTINESLPDTIAANALEPTVEMEVEGGRVDTKKTAS